MRVFAIGIKLALDVGALVAFSGVAQLQLTVHKAGLRICEPHFTHNGSHACEWGRDSVSAGDNNLVARLKIRGRNNEGGS